MKLWIDDFREAPPTWRHCRSVNSSIAFIKYCMKENIPITDIAIDHDAGEYFPQGGDFMKVMDYLEEVNYTNIAFKILTSNPYAAMMYETIIKRNKYRGWRMW